MITAPVLDLLGDPVAVRRHHARPEAGALHEVMAALRAHPAVSWCERMNTGAVKVDGRWIKFGWRGAPDLLGQLRDGRLLACEVKGPRGRLRPEQALFLELVNRHGGCAFTASDCHDVHRVLGVP